MRNAFRARLGSLLLAVAVFTPASFTQAQSLPATPATPKRPVVDKYQGVTITDNYRWLENWDDPEVKQWNASQNSRSREYLDHLPARPAIKERVKMLLNAGSASYYSIQFRGGMLFAMKDQPPQQQAILVSLRSADDPASAKVIFDPKRRQRQRLALRGFLCSFAGWKICGRCAFGKRIRGQLGARF